MRNECIFSADRRHRYTLIHRPTPLLGADRLLMTNLFAFRATLPDDMKADDDPIGPDNDRWLLESARRCDRVVCAWGRHGAFLDRAAAVRHLLRDFELLCLGSNSDGSPCHPLYQKKDLPLVMMAPAM